MTVMNRFGNPLAGALPRAGPDSKYIGIRGFSAMQPRTHKRRPTLVSAGNDDGTGYPCE